MRPAFSILDPALCLTIPKKAIAAPVFDMLSHTMERYFSETTHPDIFCQFAVHVTGITGSFIDKKKLAREGIEALEDFCHKMDLPARMQELGIDDSRYEEMAKKCCDDAGGTVGHLEKLNWQDVLNIYRLASE